MIVANALGLPYADRSAHMSATSPPYYQKRMYSGVAPSHWPEVSYSPMPGLPQITIPAGDDLLGLEVDPFAYIGHLVLIAREVWRVVRDDGVFCVNIGDTYSGSRCGPQGATGERSGRGFSYERSSSTVSNGLKQKDLMGIPWRIAFALQADGWTLRSRMPGGHEMRPDVIWTKNAMPESVRDRPSVDFEDVFIFSKSKRYFWDQENGRSAYRPMGGQHGGGFQGQEQMKPRGKNGDHHARFYGAAGANMRASWKINTEPTKEEHYAAWPRELVRRLIRVGTSDKGCCPECGAQWVRQTERAGGKTNPRSGRAQVGATGGAISGCTEFSTLSGGQAQRFTVGWSPSCDHEAEPVPCSVLDPFSGIGRTGEVCYELGRRYMPAEISAEYAAIQSARLSGHVAVKTGDGLPPRQARLISGPLFP